MRVALRESQGDGGAPCRDTCVCRGGGVSAPRPRVCSGRAGRLLKRLAAAFRGRVVAHPTRPAPLANDVVAHVQEAARAWLAAFAIVPSATHLLPILLTVPRLLGLAARLGPARACVLARRLGLAALVGCDEAGAGAVVVSHASSLRSYNSLTTLPRVSVDERWRSAHSFRSSSSRRSTHSRARP